MPRRTTCGFASRNRSSRQYRTRYHGVHARCRTTQRSEARVRNRACRGSRRRRRHLVLSGAPHMVVMMGTLRVPREWRMGSEHHLPLTSVRRASVERMISVVGSVNLDLVAEVPRLPSAGETLPATGFARVPGGKGANQALAARRLTVGP